MATELMLHGDLEPFGVGWGTTSDNMYAQLLRVGSTPIYLQRIDVRIGRWNDPPGYIQCQLWSDNSGSPGSKIGTTLATTAVIDTGVKDYTWQTVYNSGIGKSLSANTDYWVTCEASSLQFGTVQWTGDTVVADVGYLSNYTSVWYFSTNDGSSWNIGTADQMTFRYWGEEAAAPEKPINPSPIHQETKLPNGIAVNAFTWEDGGAGELNAADSFIVNFGTDFGGPDYEAETGNTTLSWLIPENIHQLMGDLPVKYLNRAQGYEWRIDAVNAAGTTQGDVWEFTTTAELYLGKARNPTPASEATGIKSTRQTITWEGCEGSAKNTLYYGTVSGQLSKAKALSGSTLSLDVTSLHLTPGVKYYWRVDTEQGAGTQFAASITGDEWWFVVDNDITEDPSGVGALPTIRVLVALTDTCLWYEDLI
jgi:hypothetical protein